MNEYHQAIDEYKKNWEVRVELAIEFLNEEESQKVIKEMTEEWKIEIWRLFFMYRG